MQICKICKLCVITEKHYCNAYKKYLQCESRVESSVRLQRQKIVDFFNWKKLDFFTHVAVILPKLRTQKMFLLDLYVGGCKTLSYSNTLNTLSNKTLISS